MNNTYIIIALLIWTIVYVVYYNRSQIGGTIADTNTVDTSGDIKIYNHTGKLLNVKIFKNKGNGKFVSNSIADFQSTPSNFIKTYIDFSRYKNIQFEIYVKKERRKCKNKTKKVLKWKKLKRQCRNGRKYTKGLLKNKYKPGCKNPFTKKYSNIKYRVCSNVYRKYKSDRLDSNLFFNNIAQPKNFIINLDNNGDLYLCERTWENKCNNVKYNLTSKNTVSSKKN